MGLRPGADARRASSLGGHCSNQRICRGRAHAARLSGGSVPLIATGTAGQQLEGLGGRSGPGGAANSLGRSLRLEGVKKAVRPPVRGPFWGRAAVALSRL